MVMIMVQGYKKTLQFDDIFATPDGLRTQHVYPSFDARFDGLVDTAATSEDAKVRIYIYLYTCLSHGAATFSLAPHHLYVQLIVVWNCYNAEKATSQRC